jgi:DNA-binding MarR family transcriptional regulator
MRGSEKPPINALASQLGYWLRYVSNQVSHALGLKLAGGGVTVAEWVLLRELYDHEPLAPSILAGRLGMTRGAISKLTGRLEDKGLIARWNDVTDLRRQDLNLTVAGRSLVPALASLADQNEEEFFGHLDPAERDAIRAALVEIVRRLGLKAPPID